MTTLYFISSMNKAGFFWKYLRQGIGDGPHSQCSRLFHCFKTIRLRIFAYVDFFVACAMNCPSSALIMQSEASG